VDRRGRRAGAFAAVTEKDHRYGEQLVAVGRDITLNWTVNAEHDDAGM